VDVTETITTAVNIVFDEHLTLLDQPNLCAANSNTVVVITPTILCLVGCLNKGNEIGLGHTYFMNF